jgi:hypothetical protein
MQRTMSARGAASTSEATFGSLRIYQSMCIICYVSATIFMEQNALTWNYSKPLSGQEK